MYVFIFGATTKVVSIIVMLFNIAYKLKCLLLWTKKGNIKNNFAYLFFGVANRNFLFFIFLLNSFISREEWLMCHNTYVDLRGQRRNMGTGSSL